MSVPQPQVTGQGDPAAQSDADLIVRVRGGDREAYGMLFERHEAAARNLARQLSRSPAEVDDMVAESFARVLTTLLNGGGPTSSFRSYVLTALRNVFYDRIQKDRRLHLSDDMAKYDDGDAWVDPAVATLESSMAARAFSRLPERWQTVLWHSEVEQESAAQIAPLLGLTPNGVSALAYRAREGLRQAYLQEHLAAVPDDQHRWTVERLGAWARGGLSDRLHAKVDGHLAGCDRCRSLGAELRELNGSLRGIIAPVVLGAPRAIAYLSASAAPEAAGAAAASLGGTGAAAAATAGAATPAASGTTGTVAGWVAAATTGKAAAAATAVLVVGTALGLGVAHRTPSAPSEPAQAAPAVSRSAAPPLPVPRENSAPDSAGATGRVAPLGGKSPTAASAAAPAATSRSAGGSSRAPQAGQPAPGTQRGPTQQPPIPTRPPGAPTGPTVPTSAAAIKVGTPAPVKPLRRGKPGEVGVRITNSGQGPATTLVATVTLPSGLTVRAGGSNSPADWHCTGSGGVATCRIAALPAGNSGTLRVKVFVADDASAGAVTGHVTGAGGIDSPIPTAVMQVEKK